MTEEGWLPVVGYEGLYEVSSLGSVRSVDRTIARRDGTSALLRGKVLRLSFRKGYPGISLSKGGKVRPMDLHRVVAEAFLGPIPAGQYTRHRNGIRSDCGAENLVYGTPTENQADRLEHGTDARGEKNSQSRLTPTDIRKIRALGSSNTRTAIGRMFGVSRTAIGQIIRGKRWGHI